MTQQLASNDTPPLDFLVRRDNLNDVRWGEPQTSPEQALESGDVLLRIDRYAFTANNITYALVGEAMHYWAFFPAPAGWGRIPVWGFADVAASRAANVHEGDRVFGYLPMSCWLHVRTGTEPASPQAFVDASEHRRHLPSVYQRYLRTQRSDAATEDLRAVLQPLSGTGFLIADWLAEQTLFDARQVVIASASSKTALATAFQLSRLPERNCEVIGLTSARNRAFCERVGYYDRVVPYTEVRSLQPELATVFIDMAGDPSITRSVHNHFTGTLRHSCFVGMTHQQFGVLAAPQPELPGPAPQMFFAPAHVDRRQKAWGPAGFAQRVSEAEQAFLSSARSWLEIVHGRGAAAIESGYRKVKDGNAEPNQGLVLSP